MVIFCKLNVLKAFPPILITLLALIFSFWLLPYDYIDPTSVGWVFAFFSENMTDEVGHAIQAMFFANESWFWPIGKLTSFGPDGGSIILAAVSPVFAIPAKLLETFGLIGQFWQFIGIQAIVGISISSLAVYFLAQALGASRIASVTAALLSLPLPNLFVLAIFNESLSWQFLAVLPMILLLRDNKHHQPLWPWIVLIGVSVWSNTYFLVMTFPFFIAHLWMLRNRHRVTLANLVSQLMIVVVLTIFLHYIGGGFLVKIYDIAISKGWLYVLSIDLADFFHLVYDKQGYVYRGRTVILLLLATLVGLLAHRFLLKNKFASSGGRADLWKQFCIMVMPTSLMAFLLFIISLGPIIRFGTTFSYALPLPDSLLHMMSVFRGIGRLSWPFIYLLLGFSALSIDFLLNKIPVERGSRFLISLALCSLLVSSQFFEFYPELIRFKSYASHQIAKDFTPSVTLEEAFKDVNEIVFVPAYLSTGQGTNMGAPWNTLSYYAIKHHIPVKTYHWLAHTDPDEESRVYNLTMKMALECRWVNNKIYVLERSYITKISRCNYEMNEVVSYPGWIVLKLK